VTDLKTANTMLAQAILALESAEHVADVSEAEAIRNRLLDLDASIGDRIQAKLDAHRLIVASWGVPDTIMPRKLEVADEPIVVIEDPLAACDADPVPTADNWAAHHETFHTEYAQSGDEITEAVVEVSVAEISHTETESA